MQVTIYANSDNDGNVGNAPSEWSVWETKLEAGSVATPFIARSHGEELSLCQRYYQQMAFSQCYMSPQQTAATLDFVFPTEMRAAPSTTRTGNFGVGDVTKKNVFLYRALTAAEYATTVTADAEL